MRRLFTAAFVLAACAMAVVLGAADAEDPRTLKSYEIELDNAFGIVKGGDLKIGGVKAGETTDLRLTESEPYRTIVEAKVTEPGFDSLRTDARCDVRQQSLIGEYFIDCDLGDAKERIPDGGRIPVERTSSTIPPDLINDVMRRPYRERFRLILAELGTGLAGRPQELNEVIRRAHPALRELTQTLAILREQNTVIRDFIRDADTVSEAVEPFKEDLARWAREASETAGIQASRAEQLGRYWNRFPEFLRELEPTLAELERTADAQIPTLRSLQRAAPELERFLRTAQPFARNSRGSVRALGEATVAGSAAIDESRQEVRQLRRLAEYAPRLGKPLRQLLQALDDRRRSTENDPAARDVAPPAPDKTAYTPGRGFTGMEALWNYIYFQTLAINATDELGHLLRIVLFAGGPCAPYNANPTQDEIKECASWLGPNQPGVTTPDTTVTRTAARSAPARSRRRAARRRESPPARSEAPAEQRAPTPRREPLTPRRLQDDLGGLLDQLGLGRRTPPAPEGSRGSGDPTRSLLDFLLGP